MRKISNKRRLKDVAWQSFGRSSIVASGFMILSGMSLFTFSGNAEVKPNPELKTVPYYQEGGFVGNGADGLDLVPEKDVRSEDAVVAPPASISSSGYIRIDAKVDDEYSVQTFQIFTLTKCKGGSVNASGHFMGPISACNTNEEIQVNVNSRTQIAPGLYTLSTVGTKSPSLASEKRVTYYEASSSDPTIFFPGIIRIEKGRTTVIPLPKIVLPQIADETYVIASDDVSSVGMQRKMTFFSWITETRYECDSKTIRNLYSDESRERRQEICAQRRAISYGKYASFWKFKKGEGKLPESTYSPVYFDNYYGNGFRSTDSYNSTNQINPPARAGRFITVFPGIYRLFYDSVRGYQDVQMGVRVGNFSEDMVGKVFPTK